jgi:hypothetical protein
MAKIVYPAGEPGEVGSDLQPRKVDIVMYKGDDFKVNVAMASADGNIVIITGWVGKSQFKKGLEVVDAEIAIKPDGKSFDLFIPHNLVQQMSGVYAYDVQFTQPDGRVRTYMGGTATVKADVTT